MKEIIHSSVFLFLSAVLTFTIVCCIDTFVEENQHTKPHKERIAEEHAVRMLDLKRRRQELEEYESERQNQLKRKRFTAGDIEL